MVERLELKSPSWPKQILEKLGFYEVVPADICPNRDTLDGLYRCYPDLAGDRTAIGSGDDGSCQSWRGYPGWWKELLEKQKK